MESSDVINYKKFQIEKKMVKMINILEECKNAKVIGIGSHLRPDGDCVGACMGLYLYLKKELPEAEVEVFLEEPAEVFYCIEGVKDIKTDFKAEKVHDVFFVLDCEKDRLGDSAEFFEKAAKTINIDHHVSNMGCADLNYIVPTASSTSELVYDLLEEEKINEAIAKAIYIGMVHDTGSFQYANTSPKTLRIAAKLIEYGFDFSKLIEETFYQKTYVQNQILGRALLESILFMDGHCIVSSVDKKTMDFYHVRPTDLDGIVNQLRNTTGVDCAIFMYETAVLQYKVSLRSNEKVNVAKVAEYFGGGGHVRAAGCILSGTFHDVINNLSLHIEEQLQRESKS